MSTQEERDLFRAELDFPADMTAKMMNDFTHGLLDELAEAEAKIEELKGRSAP